MRSKTYITILTLAVTLLIIFQGCKKQEAIKQDIMQTESDTSMYAASGTNIDSAFAQLPTLDSLKLTAYDTPPIPILTPMPGYPDKFRSSGIQGVVVLEVIVLKNGNVGDARIMKSLMEDSGGLDEAAIAAVKAWKFKPALLNKKQVDAKITIPIPFSLK